jgi:hypothetical protein
MIKFYLEFANKQVIPFKEFFFFKQFISLYNKIADLFISFQHAQHQQGKTSSWLQV